MFVRCLLATAVALVRCLSVAIAGAGCGGMCFFFLCCFIVASCKCRLLSFVNCRCCCLFVCCLLFVVCGGIVCGWLFVVC